MTPFIRIKMIRMKTLLFALGSLTLLPLQAQIQNPFPADTLSTINLEEVLLNGIRAKDDTPVTFTNVTQEEIAARNLGQDIPILLNFLPAVVTTSDAGGGIGYTGIRVRGSDATRVNVTINGIPYNDAESQGTFWVDLPDFSSSVAQFQLQRGVGTSTNGSGAFGASLNLQTTTHKEAFATIAASVGSFNTLKNTLQFSTGPLNEVWNFSGRLSRIISEGYIDRASADLNAYFFEGSFRAGNTLLRALAFGGHEITDQAWYGVDKTTLEKDRTFNPAGAIFDANGTAMGFYDNQVDDYTQNHFQFHWNQQLNKNWDFSVGLNYTHGYGFYEEYNDLWYQQNVSFDNDISFEYLQLPFYTLGETTITTTENVTRKWLDNDYYVANMALNYVTPGTTLNIGTLWSRYVGDHFGTLLWAQQAGDVLPRKRFYENQGIKSELSIFAKGQYQWAANWQGFLDLQLRTLQYEVDGLLAGPEPIQINDDFLFFNPKAGLTFTLNSTQKLYFSYARAHREPNRTDYENGSPKPESLNDFELGWRGRSPKIQWQANVYWMAYKDQLVLTGALDDVGAPIRQNVGNSRRIGLEIEGKVQWAAHWLWQPNIAFSRNENLDFYFQRDGQLQNLGRTNLAYSPGIVAGNAIIFAPSTRFQVALLTKYVGKQYMGNIDAESSVLEAYNISDLNAVYRWQPKGWIQSVEWSLLLNNLFNVAYVSNGSFYTYDDTWSNPNQIKTIEGAGYYPQAGFHFLTGVTIVF